MARHNHHTLLEQTLTKWYFSKMKFSCRLGKVWLNLLIVIPNSYNMIRSVVRTCPFQVFVFAEWKRVLSFSSIVLLFYNSNIWSFCTMFCPCVPYVWKGLSPSLRYLWWWISLNTYFSMRLKKMVLTDCTVRAFDCKSRRL